MKPYVMTGDILLAERLSEPLPSGLRSQDRRSLAFACVFLFLCAATSRAQVVCAQSDSQCWLRAAQLVSPPELQLLDPNVVKIKDSLRGVNGQNSPKDVADKVWKLIFTECTRSGDPSPSFFSASRDQTNHFTFPVAWGLTERKGTFLPPQAEALSEADRANGVEYRGKAYFKESMSRSYQFNEGGTMRRGPWSKWSDTPPQSWLMVNLEKTSDRWSFDFDGSSPYDAARYKVSCATATAPDPFATVDGKTHPDEAVDPVTGRADIARALKARNAAQQVFETARNALQSAEITVTPNEFEARFAEAVKRRASEIGFDPLPYETAIKTVDSIVHTCGAISASEFADSFDLAGLPHLWNIKDGRYGNCSQYFIGTEQFRLAPLRLHPVKTQAGSGFVIFDSLQRHWNRAGKVWNGPKFHIDIYLNSKETPVPELTGSIEAMAKYIILSADLVGDAPTSGSAPESLAPPSAPASTATPPPSTSVPPQANLFVCPGPRGTTLRLIGIQVDRNHPFGAGFNARSWLRRRYLGLSRNGEIPMTPSN